MAANVVTPETGMSARDRARAYLIDRHHLRWPEALPWLLAVAAYFLFPERMTFGTQSLIMVLFALSLDLILGYAGIVTLGHAAFFGIGAYTVALLASRYGWGEPITALFASAAISGFVGFASGWLLLRYRGLTLLVLTLSTTIMLQEIGNLFPGVTGGYDGIPGLQISPLFGVFQYDLYSHTNYIYCLCVLFVLFFVVRRIVYSPFGAALAGIRENVARMHAVGSPVHARLVAVYTIAAAIAGIAGALLAQTTETVSLDSLGFERSAEVVVILVLGGPGKLYGGLVGAMVFMVARDRFSGIEPQYWYFWIGILLVGVVLFLPNGILGGIMHLTSRWRRS